MTNIIKQFYKSEKFLSNKYNHLLIICFSLFFLAPFYAALNWRFPLLKILFFLAIEFTLHIVMDKKKMFICTIFTTIGFIATLVAGYDLCPFAINDFLYVFGRLVYCLFLAIAIFYLMRRFLQARKITGDTIKGAIAVYLMLGVLWIFVYESIFHINPSAFSAVAFGKLSFLHYSYTTLTTLGLGDITPVSNFAMSFTCLEAIVGQLFLVVFIAKLMGLHIVQFSQDGK